MSVYSITVGSNLVLLVMLYDSSLPPSARVSLATFNMFITNSMACRIFRNARAAVTEPRSRVIIVDINPRDSMGGVSIPLPVLTRRRRDETTAATTRCINVTSNISNIPTGSEDCNIDSSTSLHNVNDTKVGLRTILRARTWALWNLLINLAPCICSETRVGKAHWLKYNVRRRW